MNSIDTKLYRMLNWIALVCMGGMLVAGSAFGGNLLTKENWLYMQHEDIYLNIKNNTGKNYVIKQVVGNQELMKWPKVDMLLKAYSNNTISPLLWESGKLGVEVEGLQFQIYPADKDAWAEGAFILEVRVTKAIGSSKLSEYHLSAYLYPASEKLYSAEIKKQASQNYVKFQGDERAQTTIFVTLGDTLDKSDVAVEIREKHGVYNPEDIKRLEEKLQLEPAKLSPQELFKYQRK
jgi:hypothetical protein